MKTETPTGEKPVLVNLAAEIRLHDIDAAIVQALMSAARRDLKAWTYRVAAEWSKDFDLVEKKGAV